MVTHKCKKAGLEIESNCSEETRKTFLIHNTISQDDIIGLDWPIYKLYLTQHLP